MANFTPADMAAINAAARAGQLSPEQVQYFLGKVAPAGVMAPRDQSMSLAHQMLRKGAGAAITEEELRALVPSFLRVETGAALTEEEIQAAMEALMRPMEPSLGALPGGEEILPGEPRAAFSPQEMQGAN